MTRFEKRVVGLVEDLIATTDCGALHGRNWRLPCQQCIEQERAAQKQLLHSIQLELVARHIRAGHDERDGNRTRKEPQP